MQNYVKAIDYQYEEQQPVLIGNLKMETKDILGYSMIEKQLQNTEEENISAWYTTDIPINNGPYVFHGIARLNYVELEDSKNHYHFIW